MKPHRMSVVVSLLVAACTIAVEGRQHIWGQVGKKRVVRPQGVVTRAEPIARPQAEIAGGANGVYCTEPWDNGISVHDLGFLPAGRNVTVVVEGVSNDFNPVAAVLVPSIGQMAGNAVKTTTFYDDDSGGDRDPRIELVTPNAGTYLLMVNDLTDATVGCYRYQVMVR